jgi:two-component system sensor histidine kinase DesK
MNKWYQNFQRNTGLSPYVWVIFYILPFYFIFEAQTTWQVVFGVVLIVLFFISYVLSFGSKGWLVYFWTACQMAISIAMTFWFSYVYFSLFLALFIGNIRNKAGFITLYTIHLVTTFAVINYGIAKGYPVLIAQFPFILVNLIAMILLPVNMYNKNKQEQLEDQLDNANRRISEFVKQAERQRIARDLHDTMGQKLSLIGLKSDLAVKLMDTQPSRAKQEIRDVSQTARSALKEVREMVMEMRGMHIGDALRKVKEMLVAANIEYIIQGELRDGQVSLIHEHVASMCVMEAVTNIVKHSHASQCTLSFEATEGQYKIIVKDNGIGMSLKSKSQGSGIRGMRERLEFVNGSLTINSYSQTDVDPGVKLEILVPLNVPQLMEGVSE